MTRKKEGLAPKVSNAGHQDIYITKHGRLSVRIRAQHVGNFVEVGPAIKARDDYRIKHNLPAAKY